MKRSIELSPEQRTALLDRYRNDPAPEVRFRSHILLLLDDGHSWTFVGVPAPRRSIERRGAGTPTNVLGFGRKRRRRAS